MSIPARDRSILRELAARQAAIAALPVQQQTAHEWARVNRLEPGKPMVWINEICWNELIGPELELQCSDPFCRGVESSLRTNLYQWDHLPVDMVVEPIYYSPLAIRDTGIGIGEIVDIVRTDPTSGVVSRHYHEQINGFDDLDKIETPEVSHDEAASERTFAQLNELFGDLLTIEKRGVPGSWFAPWDELIRWWGVEHAMTDLYEKPDLVHAAMDRLVNAYCARLDQWEAQGLLSLNNTNVRVGSGGLGYVDELPKPDCDAAHLRCRDLWGCATAQIFSDVSPPMHLEFAIDYERRWLDRFGLTYYGCCEPLHLKLDVLATVPNLRKISMSPWANLAVAAEQVGGKYVLSHKPNPAVFAADAYMAEEAEKRLREALEMSRGCAVEIILKDISTLRYDPQRLWAWAEMARRVSEEYA